MNVLSGFKNLSTSGKLLVGFGFLGIVLVGVGWVAFEQLGTMQLNTQRIYEGQLEPIVALDDVDNDLQRIRQTSYAMFCPIAPDEARAVVDKARALDADLVSKSDDYEKLITTDAERTSFQRFREAMKRYRLHRESKQYEPLLAGATEKAYKEGALPGAVLYEDAYHALRETTKAQQKLAKDTYLSSQATYRSSRALLLALIATGLLVGQLLGFGVARTITQPLRRTVEVLGAVGAGDLTKRVPVDSRDEVGRMGEALNAAIDALAKACASETQQMERERAQAEDLKRRVDLVLEVVDAAADGDLTRDLTIAGDDTLGRLGKGLQAFLDDLRESISGIADNAYALAGSAEQMTTVSVQMSSNAAQTSGQASAVSSAAEQVSTSVQTVATGIEEMTISIREIAKNATQAAQVADEAVRAAESCSASIRRLSESSAEIGKVTKLITSITEQTNLLALNATIEAARAGDAGKGFAVVANEVKELAKGTARATEDVGLKIVAIQNDAQNAAQAIARISQVIHQIDDVSATIASSVEQQTATTSEIGRNVSEAARASSEIARNITGVAEGAKSTATGAGEAQRAAAQLAAMAAELQRLIGRFQCERDRGPSPRSVPAGSTHDRTSRLNDERRRDEGRRGLDGRRAHGRPS